MAGEGFPAIGDYGLIGDCHSAALISRRGALEWCCLPRFDSGSAFARLLDRRHGGHCTLTPANWDDVQTSRGYLEDTLVLQTTFRSGGGEITLTDLFLNAGSSDRPSQRQIVRVLEGRRGAMEFTLQIAPRFDYGEVRPWIRRHSERLHSAIGGNDALLVWCEAELEEDPHHELSARVRITAGRRLRLWLSYRAPELVGSAPPEPSPRQLDQDVERTVGWWRDWSRRLSLSSPDERAARRSGLVLKAMTYAPTGAIVAAPTMGLPEAPGENRNWDYRYAWVRDSSFSSRAFAEIGAEAESDSFRHFVMRSAAGHAGDLQVVYGVGGERRMPTLELGDLSGYEHSRPVLVGNGAAGQRQLDAYGELLNLAWRWHRRGHSPDDDDWRFLTSLVDHAAEAWERPDSGIWEWPGRRQHFVHSKVMCWSALEHGIRLAEECDRQAPLTRWKRTRTRIRQAVEKRGYDRQRNTFLQVFDRGHLDAALLLLPTSEFLDWRDERMVGTVAAVREELDAGEGLLYRYRRRDGLRGQEGAFLCCSFWLAECLARQGRAREARAVYDRASATANDLGLFSEEVDPSGGALLGNFPQALTHLSHISATIALAEGGSARADAMLGCPWPPCRQPRRG